MTAGSHLSDPQQCVHDQRALVQTKLLWEFAFGGTYMEVIVD